MEMARCFLSTVPKMLHCLRSRGESALALTWNLAEVGEGLPRAGAEALPGCAVHSGVAAPAAQVKAVSEKGETASAYVRVCVCNPTDTREG